MNRIFAAGTALVFSLSAVACGGGESAPGAETGQAGEMSEQDTAAQTQSAETQATELSQPDWMTVDEEANTVTLNVTAGETNANNNWNFNGYYNGNATIVVPQGSEVTINFDNADRQMAHSLGIDTQTENFPATYEEATPAFDGAVTSGATELQEATQSGESESITFTASEAGEYSMICYVPAHAVTGMWIYFEVSAEGEAGFREG